MNFKNLRRLSAVLLFVGLLWMMLPHAFHNTVSPFAHIDEHENGEEEHTSEEHEEGFSHYIHLTQGLALTIAGLAIMNYCDKKQTIKA